MTVVSLGVEEKTKAKLPCITGDCHSESRQMLACRERRKREKREGSCPPVLPCFQRGITKPENFKASQLSIRSTARVLSESTCDMQHHASFLQMKQWCARCWNKTALGCARLKCNMLTSMANRPTVAWMQNSLVHTSRCNTMVHHHATKKKLHQHQKKTKNSSINGDGIPRCCASVAKVDWQTSSCIASNWALLLVGWK